MRAKSVAAKRREGVLERANMFGGHLERLIVAWGVRRLQPLFSTEDEDDWVVLCDDYVSVVFKCHSLFRFSFFECTFFVPSNGILREKISFFVKGSWPQFRVPMQRRDENLRRQDTREYQNRGKDVSD